ncbi:MAG: response regulator, partial [Acidobacteria bacterium]|nr:response regulator [Acidobacteriota bacterium]
MRSVLEQECLRLVEVRGEPEVLELLGRVAVDLVILNATSPNLNALECCRRIRANRQTESVPILMLADAEQNEVYSEALSSGADEFLATPLHPEAFRMRIRSLLRQKAMSDRLDATEAILFALARAVEMRDHHTGGHCERLA